MLAGTYNFEEVDLVIGTRKIRGFEEGTEITAVRDADSFTKKVDNDGNVTRSRSNNNAGRVTFTLSQFSEANQYLQDLANLDERTGNGVVPVKINDKSNPIGEKVVGTEGWVVKPADRSYGAESGPREWMVDLANMNVLAAS